MDALSWVKGDVAIDYQGTVTGSGFALVAYRAIEEHASAGNPLPDPENPPEDWVGTPEKWRTAMLRTVVSRRKSWAASALASADVFDPIMRELSDRVHACDLAVASLGKRLQTLEENNTTRTVRGVL